MNTHIRSIVISALLLVGSVSSSHAQTCTGSWAQRSVSGPEWRRAHALSNDSARGVTVLFGGFSDAGSFHNYGDTWEWNGTAWIQRVVTGPSSRSGHAMVYDSVRGVTVLFGGATGFYSTYAPNGETWEWNGTAWTQRVVSGPSPRSSHRMSYDSARGVTVLFGGFDGNNNNAETWEWNGTAWNQRLVTGPSPRRDHAMAYDSVHGVTVLFGGFTASGNGQAWDAETWEWDGTVWNQRLVTGPSPRYEHAMVYDAARGATVLFGGGGAGTWTNTGNETWDWNGTIWTQHAVSGPSVRADHAMAFDSTRAATILFGGYGNDGATWEFSAGTATVTQQPAASIVTCGGIATFTTAVNGQVTPTYRWRRGGINLTDGPSGNGSFIVGSATASLSIVNARAADSGGYDCAVTTPCGTATSAAAPLTVLNCCKTDFNGSGTPDVADIFAFLSAWFAGCP